MSCEQLISALQDPQAYEVELNAKKYTVEVELLENIQSEGVAVEIQRPVQVEDPDHGVNHLSQRRLPYAGKRRVAA